MSLTSTILSFIGLVMVCAWLWYAANEMDDDEEPDRLDDCADWHQQAEHTCVVERIEKADLGPLVRGD